MNTKYIHNIDSNQIARDDQFWREVMILTWWEVNKTSCNVVWYIGGSHKLPS